jgi:hypothetical protein
MNEYTLDQISKSVFTLVTERFSSHVSKIIERTARRLTLTPRPTAGSRALTATPYRCHLMQMSRVGLAGCWQPLLRSLPHSHWNQTSVSISTTSKLSSIPNTMPLFKRQSTPSPPPLQRTARSPSRRPSCRSSGKSMEKTKRIGAGFAGSTAAGGRTWATIVAIAPSPTYSKTTSTCASSALRKGGMSVFITRLVCYSDFLIVVASSSGSMISRLTSSEIMPLMASHPPCRLPVLVCTLLYGSFHLTCHHSGKDFTCNSVSRPPCLSPSVVLRFHVSRTRFLFPIYHLRLAIMYPSLIIEPLQTCPLHDSLLTHPRVALSLQAPRPTLKLSGNLALPRSLDISPLDSRPVTTIVKFLGGWKSRGGGFPVVSLLGAGLLRPRRRGEQERGRPN